MYSNNVVSFVNCVENTLGPYWLTKYDDESAGVIISRAINTISAIYNIKKNPHENNLNKPVMAYYFLLLFMDYCRMVTYCKMAKIKSICSNCTKEYRKK